MQAGVPTRTAVERRRAVAAFEHLDGRGLKIGYVPWGPIVRAATPEELCALVVQTIIVQSLKDPPS